MAKSDGLQPPRSNDAQQYIIQLNLRSLSLETLREELTKSGVAVDPHYGPIRVNPAERNYVIRGWASPDARARAEKIDGVKFFGDGKISPANSR
jgi:hypothetical protein